jgi:hypothetical protein
MVSVVHLWLRAFALTVAVESAVAVPLLAPVEPRLWRRAALVFFANLASHPAVWFIFPGFGAPYEATLAVSEAWAVLVEIAFFFVALPGAPRARVVGTVMLANGASWGAGLLVRATTGWIG